MKTIKIYAVGKVKEKSIQSLIDEYLKRLKIFAKIEVVELKDEGIEKESEKYKTNKEMCKNMVDFYLKVSNVEEIVESVRKFGKEYNL